LLVTPVRAVDTLGGELSPYILVGIVQAGVVIWIARLLFDLLFFLSAFDAAVGLSVPVSRNAGMGPDCRGRTAADAFQRATRDALLKARELHAWFRR
jgi:hypothetical protein